MGALLGTAAAQSQTVLDVYDATAENPDDWVLVGQIQPIVTAQTGAEHYDYFASSGHPSGVNLGALRANTWMHEDSNTGDLTFGFIFGMENGGVTNDASLLFRVVGSDTDPFVSQGDEPGEVAETPPGSDIFVGDFQYNPCCSDGVALSGIGGDTWTVIIDAVDFGNITEWLMADGAEGEPDLDLVLGNQYRITPEGNDPSDLPPDEVCDGIAVTDTVDAGPGSLRQALTDANATAEPDTICFVIPGPGPHTIAPLSALPAVADSVLIDGYTQPGARENTLAVGSDAVIQIELDGTDAGDDSPGLLLAGSGTTVRGLAVGNFDGDLLRIEGGSGNVVEGMFLGTDASGAQARSGDSGVWIENASGNRIGGTTPAARNVIAGDTGGGFYALPDAPANQVLNTYFGTDPTGALSVGDSGGGLFVLGADDTVIGAPGAGNVIAGEDGGRLFVLAEDGDPAERTMIQGNYIGTNAAGDAALGDTGGGVFIDGAPDTRLGGTGEGEGNLISGNEPGGVFIQDDGPVRSAGTVVQGNLVGTDATGTFAVPNCCGIDVRSAGVLVGGTEPGARNVVSGNTADGITLDDSSTVQGNYLGTDITGTQPLGNADGALWIDGAGNLVGGTEPGAGNVIAATGPDLGGVGIIVRSGATGNVIQGNFIGTDAAETEALGNGYGIALSGDDTSDNRIGGTEPGEGNVIAHSVGPGIAMNAGPNNSVLGNAVLGNRIYGNGGLGIDLGDDGVTNNDAGDGDEGPNGRQNFPVLASDGSPTLTGTLDSAPDASFRIEFFRNDAADPSGHGEGEMYLGFTDVTTDGSGQAAFTFELPATIPIAGAFITATATDAAGNTSEFSAAAQVAVASEDDALPTVSALHEPYPNPARGRVTLRYDLAEAGAVRIGVYDVLGRAVTVLADGDKTAGRHEAVLDGRGLAAGVYLVRMTAEEGFQQTRPLTLVR